MTDDISPDDLCLSPLEQLVAWVVDQDPNATAYQDERFCEWLLQEAHARLTPRERRENERAARAFARRMRARIIAERIKGAIPLHDLSVRDAPAAESLRTAVVHAAREGCAPWIEDSQVAAGLGRELWDEPCERWVALPEGLRRGDHIAISVRGDSMIPVILPDDVIVVRMGAPAKVGQLVVASHPDHGYVVKHVSRVGRITLELESFNPDYAPFHIARDPRLVIGTVTHILRQRSS